MDDEGMQFGAQRQTRPAVRVLATRGHVQKNLDWSRQRAHVRRPRPSKLAVSIMAMQCRPHVSLLRPIAIHPTTRPRSRPRSSP